MNSANVQQTSEVACTFHWKNVYHHVHIINHNSHSVRLRQLRAGCPHMDIMLAPGERMQRITDETGRNTLIGLSAGTGVSILSTATPHRIDPRIFEEGSLF